MKWEQGSRLDGCRCGGSGLCLEQELGFSGAEVGLGTEFRLGKGHVRVCRSGWTWWGWRWEILKLEEGQRGRWSLDAT